MSRRHISQREAHATERKVRALEALEQTRRSAYARDYPGGVHMVTLELRENLDIGRLEASQRLGCALVARLEGAFLRIYAVKP